MYLHVTFSDILQQGLECLDHAFFSWYPFNDAMLIKWLNKEEKQNVHAKFIYRKLKSHGR